MLNKKTAPKCTFDFSQFPNFNILNQLDCLPDEVKEKYFRISAYIENTLSDGERIFIIYPPNNEVVIEDKSNINSKKLTEIRNLIYDYVVYDKLLP